MTLGQDSRPCGPRTLDPGLQTRTHMPSTLWNLGLEQAWMHVEIVTYKSRGWNDESLSRSSTRVVTLIVH